MSLPLVFVHGWSLNSTMWQPVIACLPDLVCKTIDLGFVEGGEPNWQDVSEPAIYIGHSLGALWLLEQWQRSEKKIVPAAFISIAGFCNFTRFTSPRSLALMKRGIARSPAAQLNHFWKQAGIGWDVEVAGLCPERLNEGLDWLESWDGSEMSLRLDCPKLLLASRRDKIVPAQASCEEWGELSLTWHETAPHALPLAEPAWTAGRIRDFLVLNNLV